MLAIDFFCGAGGLTKGLQLSGINVIAGIDLSENCRETFSHNCFPARYINEDIRKVDVEVLRALAPAVFENPSNVLFAGCAPCQSFSKQRRSVKTRPDATILGQFGRLVEAFQPGQVLVENVPGIAKIKGRSTFIRFLQLLKRNNYNYVFDTINAKNFGIPQNRRRMVLIAVKNGMASLPVETHGKNKLPFETVRNTITRFPRLEVGEESPDFPNHCAAELSETNLRRIRSTPPDGGDRRSWNDGLVLECHKGGHAGHTDVYGRMHWDQPSPTLTGRCNSLSNGRYGHPEQDRAISLREAAALQTFPDDFVFFGSRPSIAQQIGNAVPVRLGMILGQHIQNLRNALNEQ